LRRQPGAEATLLGGELVVLDAEGKMVRALNGTAARVWELLDGAHSVEEICRVLGEEFEAPAAAIERDVAKFLAALERAGLLVR
jgi:hypothetical protein